MANNDININLANVVGPANATADGLALFSGTGGKTLKDAAGALTSANLRAALSDETGTGAAVFATSPTLVTPAVSGLQTITPAVGSSALTVAGVTQATSQPVLDLSQTWNAGAVTADLPCAASHSVAQGLTADPAALRCTTLAR